MLILVNLFAFSFSMCMVVPASSFLIKAETSSLRCQIFYSPKPVHSIVTSVYHPQTNGLTERFNQALSNCLVSKINESQNNWDDKLDEILFSYRVSKQASTKYSPYFLMFGRHPHLFLNYGTAILAYINLYYYSDSG